MLYLFNIWLRNLLTFLHYKVCKGKVSVLLIIPSFLGALSV
jgi:hypothetical protein